MALSDYYNQTFQRFTKGNSSPSDPSPTDTDLGSEFNGTLKNRGGSLPLDGGKLTVNYDSKIMCDKSVIVNSDEWIRHVDTGVEYKVIRIDSDAGLFGNPSSNAHQSIYLEVNK